MTNKSENHHEGHRDRLKRQYMVSGAQPMLDHQLLELLLFYSIPRRDTNTLAHELITKFGGLKNVFKADRNLLANCHGVGENTAALISLVADIYERALYSTEKDAVLSTPDAAMQYCIPLLHKEPNEIMCVLSLSKHFKLVGTEFISIGTISHAAIYPRSIVASAIKYNAHSVILCHNHPSGSLQPSSHDLETTKMAAEVLRSVQINLFDHIIVGHDCALSLRSNSILSNRLTDGDTVRVPDLEDWITSAVGISSDSMKIVADELSFFLVGESYVE